MLRMKGVSRSKQELAGVNGRMPLLVVPSSWEEGLGAKREEGAMRGAQRRGRWRMKEENERGKCEEG